MPASSGFSGRDNISRTPPQSKNARPGKRKQQRQPQHVLVEGDGAIEVGDGDGDLADCFDPWSFGRHGSL